MHEKLIKYWEREWMGRRIWYVKMTLERVLSYLTGKGEKLGTRVRDLENLKGGREEHIQIGKAVMTRRRWTELTWEGRWAV